MDNAVRNVCVLIMDGNMIPVKSLVKLQKPKITMREQALLLGMQATS